MGDDSDLAVIESLFDGVEQEHPVPRAGERGLFCTEHVWQLFGVEGEWYYVGTSYPGGSGTGQVHAQDLAEQHVVHCVRFFASR